MYTNAMQTILIILVVIAAIVNIALIFAVLRKRGPDPVDKSNDIGLKLILEQINELNRSVDTKMHETTRNMSDTMHRQFTESQKIITNVTEKLTKLDETNRQVVSFADQLQNLQDILKNPKQRGILGEYYLETLLRNVLPPGGYQMQYPFANEEGGSPMIVDAVVFVKDKIIPIDSKFSLENYNRLVEEKDPLERERLEKAFKGDLKDRIDETSKYIQPTKGTMDFAFMFIPHEAIYYDLLVAQVGGMKINTRDLIEYAFKEKHVLIVSPTSFLAFLQTVLQGLKALQIEETAKDIVKRVEDLGKHLKAFEEYHRKLGNKLGEAVSHYNATGKEFKKIDKDVMRITGASNEIEAITIEKPENEE